MEKINIAELLRDCPKDMELDCTMYEDAYFAGITENLNFPIRVKINVENIKGGNWIKELTLTSEGKLGKHPNAKCIIFPKNKTTWEGFVPPCQFKDGDVVFGHNSACSYVAIYKNYKGEISFNYYACFTNLGIFRIDCFADNQNLRLATEEEKQRLFDAIKANGYKWNPETKNLEKLIKPIFKKGDKVRVKNRVSEPRIARVIKDVCDTFYTLDSVGKINFTDQYNWELVPNKFDITTLKPFDKVLVRDNNEQKWTIDYFSFVDKEQVYPFICVGHYVSQCIPYKNNEYLRGTIDNCNDFYKTWEDDRTKI